ncbi:hypothetical protein DPMN_133127 [Dreissena polymorpha]|uniref:Uncharacterized protein n=1 Tax=Dreissena polymorpha TaxID=45954 RepID=A0A9D4FTP0_DREPO|nr:hypothetical protein DPMN_133127 [Dreissena polymorpha]
MQASTRTKGIAILFWAKTARDTKIGVANISTAPSVWTASVPAPPTQWKLTTSARQAWTA